MKRTSIIVTILVMMTIAFTARAEAEDSVVIIKDRFHDEETVSTNINDDNIGDYIPTSVYKDPKVVIEVYEASFVEERLVRQELKPFVPYSVVFRPSGMMSGEEHTVYKIKRAAEIRIDIDLSELSEEELSQVDVYRKGYMVWDKVDAQYDAENKQFVFETEGIGFFAILQTYDPEEEPDVEYKTTYVEVIDTSTPVTTTSEFLYELEADIIYKLGFVKGTGNGLELGRHVTRTEALILLLRLLVLEDEALACEGDHPFVDVPDWANRYVAYAYANGYTNGVSATRFDADAPVSAGQFVTFMLRGLGHDDRQGHFTYKEALSYADSINLLTSDEAVTFGQASHEFLRDHCMRVFYSALHTNERGSDISISKRLINEGVISAEKADLLTNNAVDINGVENGWSIPAHSHDDQHLRIDAEDILGAYPDMSYYSVLTYEDGKGPDDLSNEELKLRLSFLPYLNKGFREMENLSGNILIRTAVRELSYSPSPSSIAGTPYTGDHRCLVFFDEDKNVIAYSIIEESCQETALSFINVEDLDVQALYDDGKKTIEGWMDRATEKTRDEVETIFHDDVKANAVTVPRGLTKDEAEKYWEENKVEPGFKNGTHNVGYVIEGFDYKEGDRVTEEQHFAFMAKCALVIELAEINPQRDMYYIRQDVMELPGGEFHQQYYLIPTHSDVQVMMYYLSSDDKIYYSYEQ